jgi:hypothetical protein
MPDLLANLATEATTAATALRRRDELVRDARRAGHTLREIAAAASLSPQAVKNICDRNE